MDESVTNHDRKGTGNREGKGTGKSVVIHLGQLQVARVIGANE